MHAHDCRPDVVHAELAKILASPGFVNSVRLQRFLTFAVEKWLDGRTNELKESVLAVEVFDRRADYDPRLDSVVLPSADVVVGGDRSGGRLRRERGGYTCVRTSPAPGEAAGRVTGSRVP